MSFHLFDGFIGGALPSMLIGNASWGFGMTNMEAISIT
jgi:hypothetical protein